MMNFDLVRFENCLGGEGAIRVRADVASAKELGLTGTPSFLLGVVGTDYRVKVLRRLSGAASIEQFERLIDSVLQRAQANPG
jgi:predicted DsbA family dithiol-disulfide isomerase